MPRRTQAQIRFDALSIEGALFPPEWLARIAALDAPVQSPADYGVLRGLQLRDEIGRYWRIAGALWTDFADARGGTDAVGATRRLVRDLLVQVFGFGDLAVAGERVVGGRAFPVTFEAGAGRVPVVVGPPVEALDQSVPRHGDGIRRRSAWGALQEYLNANDAVVWGIATNGLALRVGRGNGSLTRPAWIEADLERIFAEERFPDFSVLWLLLHASRFGRADQPVHESPLERWRHEAQQEGTAARAAMADNVEQALLALGQGFLAHPANSGLHKALADKSLTKEAYFNELLRLVYRMIFVLTVEERGILHPADVDPEAARLFGDGYGMRRLRERSLRRAAHDRHGDLWASLRPVFAALGRAEGEPSLGLPGLGGLFGPEQCPHLDGAALENRALLTAVFHLAWLRVGGALARVNWKDMGVEEFGSVYESLLELVPIVGDGGRLFSFAGAGDSAGNARKLTGSYYTPDALVQQLLDTALEPVVARRVAEHPTPADAERALLSLAIIDPACGSGHFLLAAARRLAGHLARLRAGGTPGADEYRHALRDVVTHCIHGVDRNPMALELARMALWLEAYTPDRALGFLDHHLVCGDALLGLLDLGALRDGIPDDAFSALTGDDKEVARILTKLNRAGRKALTDRAKSGQFAFELGTGTLAEAFAGLDAVADDGIAGVEAKRARHGALQVAAAESPLALAADCFVGAFLMPKRLSPGEQTITELQAAGRFPTTAAMVMALEGTVPAGHSAIQAARRACTDARVLHWPLAFPHVFARGGFDVVLGNPPWDVSQLREEEFFAVRAPHIASARSKVVREQEIARLADAPRGSTERKVHDDFLDARRRSEAVNDAYRGNPRFALTAVGRMNTYALFAETSLRLAATRGRVGVVVPTGIATDDSTKLFFHEIAAGRLVSLLDFRTGRDLFADIGHQRYKFCLLTLGEAERAEYAFFMTSPAQLKDPRRRFSLSSEDIALINPSTRTCPVFWTSDEAELAKKIYRRNGILRSEDPARDAGWGVRLRQMFNKSTDAGILHQLSEPADSHTGVLLPVFEGEFGHQFNHRYASVEGTVVRNDDRWLADPKNSVRTELGVSPSNFEKKLRSMELSAAPCKSAFLGFRRVARSTDERTVIACLYPWMPSTYGWLLTTEVDARELALLCGLYNTIVFDWLVRCALSQPSIPYGVFEQVAVPPRPRVRESEAAFVASRVLKLSFSAYDMAPWAKDVGFFGEPFPWDASRRTLLRAELDAQFARLYGLTRDELRYILDPTDVMGADYPSETFRVLRQNEERHFGEYRTQRLVLAAYDALEAGGVPPSWAAELATVPASPRPNLDAAVDAMLVAVAIVWAAGGAVDPLLLARAFQLRRDPTSLLRRAPRTLAGALTAWTDAVGVRVGAQLSARAVVALLEDRDALQWWTGGGAGPSLATTPDTPAEGEIDPWFQYEARLLLALLEAMPESESSRLDRELPSEDRELVESRVA